MLVRVILKRLEKQLEDGKMKRIYFKLALGLSLLSGCQILEQPQDTGYHESVSEPEFEVQLEGCNDATKTALTSERSIIWSAEDQLAVFQGHSVADTYQVKPDCVGTSHGNFEIVTQADGEAEAELQANVAIYPYQAGLECLPVSENGAVISYQIAGLTIPSVQTYAPGSFPEDAFVMAGLTSKLSDHNLKFKNVCGALKLQLKGTSKVKDIELRGNDGECLSGDLQR